MAKGPKTKKKSRVIEAEGVAHIQATFNNTLITISDMQGNAITWGSAGKSGFKGWKKSTPSPRRSRPRTAPREALSLGVKRVHVRVQGPGSGRESAIQALQAAGARSGRSKTSPRYPITAVGRPSAGVCNRRENGA